MVSARLWSSVIALLEENRSRKSPIFAALPSRFLTGKIILSALNLIQRISIMWGKSTRILILMAKRSTGKPVKPMSRSKPRRSSKPKRARKLSEMSSRFVSQVLMMCPKRRRSMPMQAEFCTLKPIRLMRVPLCSNMATVIFGSIRHRFRSQPRRWMPFMRSPLNAIRTRVMVMRKFRRGR